MSRGTPEAPFIPQRTWSVSERNGIEPCLRGLIRTALKGCFAEPTSLRSLPSTASIKHLSSSPTCRARMSRSSTPLVT